ncbi:putative carboxylic ester hydrolase [Medicago truncatula]|uniref:Phospholipase A1 n=1 Tax=Medicago truncatula TaxID=3880 RepID=G7JPP2_MEDTR|nr:phospholipase A1-IIgamma [Medicago truncatula]AES90317.1 phospholipase A1 [Medicago truncatula]RHN62305.1 putative carboxylic ester hydrolase [Medicago truncatula]
MGSIPSKKDMGSIAKTWRELSGKSKWKGLLEPLHIDLRKYLLHYGQFAQATYDAFNFEKASKYAGNCRYSKKDFFSKVYLEEGNPYKYSVTKYLYATSKASDSAAFLLTSIFSKDAWSLESNWIGYVAVATDEAKEALGRRDIVVVWRGTIQGSEWVQNFNIDLDPAPLIFGPKSNVQIHNGFYSLYTSENSGLPSADSSARKQVLNEISRLVELYKNEEISITVTGHSLGGALATISSVDIVANKFNMPKEQPQKACPVTTFAFGAPRVGNSYFQKIFSDHKDLSALFVRNENDIVPKSLTFFYYKVGEELEIDTEESKYLKSGVSAHNMEVYLHGIAGTQGSKGGFNLEVNRDIALLNKSNDGLKDEYHIPENWRVVENKGMVQQSDGTWKLMDDHNDDVLIMRAH